MMKEEFQKITAMGDRAILIDFPPGISQDLLEEILRIKEFISDELAAEEVELSNTYSSLLLYYREPLSDAVNEILRLRKLLKEVRTTEPVKKSVFEIPVCYDQEFSPDMDLVSSETELDREEVIRRHSTPVYTLFFTGFLPGFPYLGGLDRSLRVSRRKNPRLRVPQGAVAIGEEQTGIYPRTSPGGWQIIGNSPVPLFEPRKTPPVPIAAGDRIRFVPISEAEHGQISKAVQEGKYQIKSSPYEE